MPRLRCALMRWLAAVVLITAIQPILVRSEATTPPAASATRVLIGIMSPGPDGTPVFTEAVSAPSSASFGVKVVRSDDEPYRMQVVITAPGNVPGVQGGLLRDDSGDATVITTQALVYSGTVTRMFNVDADDPLGRYKFEVYIDGQLAGAGSINVVKELSL